MERVTIKVMLGAIAVAFAWALIKMLWPFAAAAGVAWIVWTVGTHNSERRRWRRACGYAGLDPAPRLVGHDDTPAGTVLRLMASGWTPADLERYAPKLAAYFRARSVEVSVNPRDAARIDLLVRTRDPLGDASAAWPWTSRDRVSLWEDIPVGVDENGGVVTVRLPERHVLIGGATGAGKSVAQSQLIAAAAMDPNATLWLIDGKEIDLEMWRPRAHASAGGDIDDALRVLRAVESEMNRRYAWLRDNGYRKLYDGMPLGVLVWDEMADFFGRGRKEKEVADIARRIVAKGRGAGIVVIGAVQKSTVDAIPSAIRDNLTYRWALSCTTPQMSDAVLGQGWAAQGYNAQTIPSGTPGIGYLHAGSDVPIRIRSFYLTDRDIDRIAGQCAPPVGAADDGPATDRADAQNGAQRARIPVGDSDARNARPEMRTGNGRSAETGVAVVPVVVAPNGKTTRTQRVRALVEATLRDDPGLSNREIARRCDCSEGTVRNHRKRLGL